MLIAVSGRVFLLPGGVFIFIYFSNMNPLRFYLFIVLGFITIFSGESINSNMTHSEFYTKVYLSHLEVVTNIVLM